MRSKLNLASNIALVSSLLAALASSGISRADPGTMQLPMALTPEAAAEPFPTNDSSTAANPAAEESVVAEPVTAVPAPSPAAIPEPGRALTLASLVSSQPQLADLPRELNCLAGAIYFESKSESLSGQLAVGRVIVARSKSGRFPNSYCGVVFQPSQFSFVRGGGMPGIARGSQQWRTAVAIAQIAHAGSWRSPVEGALFFHAAYVSPAWRLARVGRIENHVFYR